MKPTVFSAASTKTGGKKPSGNGWERMARGFLRKAIEAYRKGFETDWRDAYPGVNALTLIRIAGEPDEEYDRLRPVVGYAVNRKISSGEVDYWDYATLLELAVLDRDQNAAFDLLPDVLASVRETWEPESTANNLSLIAEAMITEGTWIAEIANELKQEAIKRKGV